MNIASEQQQLHNTGFLISYEVGVGLREKGIPVLKDKHRIVTEIILWVTVVIHGFERSPFHVGIPKQYIATGRLAAFQMTGALDDVGRQPADRNSAITSRRAVPDDHINHHFRTGRRVERGSQRVCFPVRRLRLAACVHPCPRQQVDITKNPENRTVIPGVAHVEFGV